MRLKFISGDLLQRFKVLDFTRDATLTRHRSQATLVAPLEKISVFTWKWSHKRKKAPGLLSIYFTWHWLHHRWKLYGVYIQKVVPHEETSKFDSGHITGKNFCVYKFSIYLFVLQMSDRDTEQIANTHVTLTGFCRWCDNGGFLQRCLYRYTRRSLPPVRPRRFPPGLRLVRI